MNKIEIINNIKSSISTEYLISIQDEIQEYLESEDHTLVEYKELIYLFRDRYIFLEEEERLNTIKELFRNTSHQFSISFFDKGNFINTVVSQELKFSYDSIMDIQRGRENLMIDKKLKEVFSNDWIFDDPVTVI